MADAHDNLTAVAPSSGSLDRYAAEQPNAIAVRSIDDIKRLSLIFIKSGMFKGDDRASDEQKMYQAGVKIIAGVEFGIQPFAAMRGINIIKGNAEMSANLMAAKVKKHPKYDYRVTQWDNDGCVIKFFELPRADAPRAEWDELGESSFSHDDAVKARLAGGDNWQKFARNMYFARAMSNGVRIYTPDVFYGAPVYTEGEISGSFEEAPAPRPAEPAEAEIVDAAAPDVDQMAQLDQETTRAETKSAVEALEAEIAEEDQPTTQWDAAEVAREATPDVTPDHRRLNPKKTARIYKLGKLLALDSKKLEKRVSELKNNQEADEAIAILEEDLRKRENES